MRILIAEDSSADVLLVREALQTHALDAELTVEREGAAMWRAIEEIESGARPCPDVILLDLNLPRYSGEKLLERLRRSTSRCSRIPVIIVTSSDAQRDRDEVHRLGATAYFRKPSDYDEFMRLGEVIRGVVQR